MKFSLSLLLSILFFLSCKKTQPEPINLLQDALLYQTESEESAVSENRLFRGERVIILKESVRHYLVRSRRLNIQGWIAKKYILNREFSLGTVVSQGKLRYAEGNVLIPTDITPEINSRLIILGEHKEWYLVNYRGARTFYIEKRHIRLNSQIGKSTIHIEGLGSVDIHAPFQDLSVIGYENLHNIEKIMDNNINTCFISSAFNNEQIIEIALPSQMRFELKIINGNGKNINAYRHYGRIFKLNIISENGTKQVTLKDNEMDFQNLGLFNERVIKLHVKDIYPGNGHPGFAISEMLIKPVDQREYEVYQELLARRKTIIKHLLKANVSLRNNAFHEAIQYLEKAQDELPEKLKVSYLGLGIKIVALRIYLEKLKDFSAAEQILDTLLSIAETEKNRLIFDLSRSSRSNLLVVDMQGVHAYFNEKQFRTKSNYHFPSLHLKSHIFYLAGKTNVALNRPSDALKFFKRILLETRKFTGLRDTPQEVFYSKLVLDFMYQDFPSPLVYSFLKDKVLPEYETGRDEREDENYIYYILGQLSEKAAHREEAVALYKRCLNIPSSHTGEDRPFSFTLALKRLREMGER